jgi:hypothetical protein
MGSGMIIKGTVLLELFTTEFALVWSFSFADNFKKLIE